VAEEEGQGENQVEESEAARKKREKKQRQKEKKEAELLGVAVGSAADAKPPGEDGEVSCRLISCCTLTLPGIE